MYTDVEMVIDERVTLQRKLITIGQGFFENSSLIN